jgi:TolB protein
MKGWETQLPASFPIERVLGGAVREGERRRSRRRRRRQGGVSAACALLLIGGAVLVAGRDEPSNQIQAGPGPTGAAAAPDGDGAPAAAGAAAPMANGKIAFVRSTGPTDPAPRIYVMNEDGSGQTMIAETTRGGSLTWSPDGTRLAFSDVGGIYTVDRDGAGEKRVPGTSNGDQWPSWSPDGTRLVVRNAEGAGGIYVVNVDGSGRRKLGDDMMAAWPAWSPDGRRIAYSTGEALYLVNADGSGRKRLSAVGASNDEPTWSPDGRKIAFRYNETISVVDVDGGETRSLATPGGTGLANPTGQGANKLASGGGTPATPQWSPDGRKIVYALYQNAGACSIWIMNADGSGQAALTANGTCDRDPAWQPQSP